MTKIALTKKYKTYPEYKDSGVDWLGQTPSTWDVNKLRRIFRIKKEIANKDGLDVLSITQRGVKRKDTETNEGQLSNDYSKYQLVKRGDFAMNHMDLLTGFVDISPYDGVVSPDYRVFVPRHADIFDRYFLYLFQMGYQRKIFYAYGRGAAQFGRWRFPAEEFKNFFFPVPSMDEQKRIADFLDEKTALIDRIIEKKQWLIELLKEKRAAVINHAVTKGLDPKAKMIDSGLPWVGSVPQSWELIPNKVFLRKVKGQVGERFSEYPLLSLTKQGIVLRDTEENKGKFSADMSTFQIVSAGNLVFCLFDIQETPRTVGLSKLNGMITGAYSVFECPDQTLARFVEYFYIAMDDQKRLSYLYSGLRNTITPPKFLRIHTPIPPRDVRIAIVEHIELRTKKIDTVICDVEHSVKRLQEFKSSLISHAVTGKIRV